MRHRTFLGNKTICQRFSGRNVAARHRWFSKIKKLAADICETLLSTLKHSMFWFTQPKQRVWTPWARKGASTKNSFVASSNPYHRWCNEKAKQSILFTSSRGLSCQHLDARKSCLIYFWRYTRAKTSSYLHCFEHIVCWMCHIKEKRKIQRISATKIFSLRCTVFR